MAAKPNKSVQLVFRVEEELARLADEVVALVSASIASGSRAAILRTALRRGLEQMKSELGGAKPKRK